MECKYFEDATIFDCDFNEIEYKYCMLFDDECKKARRKKDCPYRLHKQLKRKEQENAELKEENYQLQKDCQICENFIDFIPCKPIRDMDYDLQKVISQRDKYYQTLQEIKNFLELP